MGEEQDWGWTGGLETSLTCSGESGSLVTSILAVGVVLACFLSIVSRRWLITLLAVLESIVVAEEGSENDEDWGMVVGASLEDGTPKYCCLND